MTCLGHRSPAILPECVHLSVYASVNITELLSPLQVIQRSLLSSFRDVVVYASFYAVAPGCFGVMRAFMSSFRAVLVYYAVIKWGFMFLIIFQVL